jgi:hypothetical protein
MQHSRDVPFRLLTSGHNQEMMPSSAAAVEFAGPRQVRVAAVALPEPGPDEVVVTTDFSGINGGRELLAPRGEIDPGVPLDDRIESLDGTFTYPFLYGYACVGEADGQPVFAFRPHQNQFVARRYGCDRVRRVAAEVAHGAQNVDPQPVVLLDTRLPPERDELAAHAVDQGQGARQLKRVAFTFTEQSVAAEGCRGDVEDPHARLPSDHRMSRAAQRRLPLPLPPGRTGG